MNDLILRIAGGKGGEIEDNWKSEIWDVAKRVGIRNEEPKVEPRSEFCTLGPLR